MEVHGQYSPPPLPPGHGPTATIVPAPPHFQRLHDHTHTHTHHTRQDFSGRVISSTQRPFPDNTHETRHPRTQRDSNPQPQQTSGHRPTPWTTRPLGSVVMILTETNNVAGNFGSHYRNILNPLPQMPTISGGQQI